MTDPLRDLVACAVAFAFAAACGASRQEPAAGAGAVTAEPADAGATVFPGTEPAAPDGGPTSAAAVTTTPATDGGVAAPDGDDGGVDMRRDAGEHCILLALRRQTEESAARVEEWLTEKGLRPGREGPDVAVQMTEDDLGRVFGARIRWVVTAASARPTMIREAHIVGGRVPASLRGLVRSFTIGHQICE